MVAMLIGKRVAVHNANKIFEDCNVFRNQSTGSERLVRLSDIDLKDVHCVLVDDLASFEFLFYIKKMGLKLNGI